ncbi:hypothetical protein [Acinetobacter sp. A47]|uniref:hypothetical protein n=1 Tax=Acinetobacter sp. A47 TaxID=1561217 RepID=UPI00056E0E5C|nr:hypothetical protein [Acinetobacter sp. A47]
MKEIPRGIKYVLYFHKTLLDGLPLIEKFLVHVHVGMHAPHPDVVCMALRPYYNSEGRAPINALLQLKVPFTLRQRYYDSTTVTESPFHVNDGHWTMQPFRFLPNGQTNVLDPYIDDPYRFTEEDIQMTKTAIMRETINPVLGKL